MKIPQRFEVKSIPRSKWIQWVKNRHYAKRVPPVEYAFGLFDNDEMVGVLTIGTPVSSTLRNLFKGEYKVMELNRLVVNNGLPKNCLSYFVSKAMQAIPPPIVIVSYADTSMGHHGYIYQATNWLYTGLSIKFKDPAVVGMEHMHHSTIEDLARGKKDRIGHLRKLFGERLYFVDRPQKHRYMMFIGSKRDKKKMAALCPYEILTYPKGDNSRYDSSGTIVSQLELF